ncbi:hypothetical protein [Parenemella sanctibonifatiensis]|uniref:Uncharacterized protein n=1 Tax=Parenemella sanctibonifatiensis TaxID=2016505 RepID=A0A255E4S0_9ACTN|nr:hypothetical protein [Parenemella sanctibonifatiensis]OYN86496.1 hypothetical protein CGZ92_09120 [Parenemella sanctibonifatiensis]
MFYEMPAMHSTTDQPLTLSVELDLRGDGTWVTYDRFAVDGYRFIEFPDALSAYWVRLRTDRDTTVTAQFSHL